MSTSFEGPPAGGESRRRYYEQGGSKWDIKSFLRIASTGFALPATILFAVAVAYTNQDFVNLSGNGDWSDGLALAPLVLALIYNPVVLFLHLISSRFRKIHPGIHIAGDFIIWGLCIPAIIFTIGGGMFMYWSTGIPNMDGVVDCGFWFNMWAPQCNAIAYTIGKIEIAGIVMLFVVFIAHLALFAISCVDAYKWKKAANMSNFSKKDFELQSNKDTERPSYEP